MVNQLAAVTRFLRHGFDGMLTNYRQYGPVFSIGPYTYLMGPDANKFVFANPQLFSWSKAFSFLKPAVGETSMIVSDGAEHKRRRGLVQPAFHHRHVNGYLAALAKDADALIDSWQDGQRIDFDQEFQRGLRRMSVRSLFGDRIGEQADHFGDQLEAAISLVEEQPLFIGAHRILRTPAWRRAQAGKQAVDEQIMAEIARVRAGSADSGVLAKMTTARDDDGAVLSDIEIRDQALGLIAAGFSAVSSAMTWIVHLLTDNAREWDLARAEVTRVLGDRPATGEDLHKLVRVHGVVQETLRLRPPTAVSVRVPVEDFTYAGKRIRAGRKVFYSPYVTHRLAEIWPEPERFMPERWDPAHPAYRKPGPHEFLPFGGGPHRCVGSTLAISELTVLLTRLLARVELDLEPGSAVPTKAVPIRPRDGLRGRVGRAGHLRLATRPTSP
ncbi:cytochrome P450 [Kibdelosporangium philippinense]|uniref:Cytochrome P450 n=1 Tax=Kibdelosporangium philippinense TaxID=211113 RepID=A0ABS8Z2Z2_9PSEU|nr:cytochrome P450 [Kibdelosporangium philippinense]MCE7001284.1 cytochrome P450 [Kibdelosporangium philippinense]